MTRDSDPTTSGREHKPSLIHVCLKPGQTFSLRLEREREKKALSLSLLPSALLPPLIMSDDTRPHRRKIHSHRSLGPVTVATIILEEETLAINYMCAFHLLPCGGEPSAGPRAGTARWGNARVTRCQYTLPPTPPLHPLPWPFIGRHLKPSFKFHLYAPLTQKPQPPGGETRSLISEGTWGGGG